MSIFQFEPSTDSALELSAPIWRTDFTGSDVEIVAL
jgi:hypothetical protein